MVLVGYYSSNHRPVLIEMLIPELFGLSALDAAATAIFFF